MRDDSPWAPLRSRIFLALFIAQLASNLGALMQSVGAAWLIGDLGGSATLIALVQTATFLPMFLIGIPAGAIADVVDRRMLILCTQAAMMVVAFGLAALTFSGHATPTGVLALTFALGLAGALNSPAWMAIQPDLVPKDQFPQAVALGAMTYNVGRALGPALGGLVVAAAGPGWVFALNGLSFLGILVVVHGWRPPPSVTSMPVETLAGAARAGMRYAANTPLLRSVLVRVALLTFPGAALQALLPIVARGPLGLGSGGYGLLLGCFGTGAALAAVVRPRLTRRLHADALIVASSLTTAAVLLVQGYGDQPVVIGAALFIGGIAWSSAAIALIVSAQAALPSWVRARGMAYYTLVLTGCLAFGSAIAGVLAGRDLERAHLIAAVMVLVGALIGRRWPITSSREVDLTMLPGDEPTVVLAPSPTDGPVLVTVAYTVPPEDMATFVERMRAVERHRRRTGAYRWGLFRDLAAPDRFLETFVVSSWAEHLRQHHRRTAITDELVETMRPYVTDDHPVGHYISAYSEGGLKPRPPDPDLELLVEET
ncbi:MAG: MFS transporter [Acidimicrobiales bacterium]